MPAFCLLLLSPYFPIKFAGKIDVSLVTIYKCYRYMYKFHGIVASLSKLSIPSYVKICEIMGRKNQYQDC